MINLLRKRMDISKIAVFLVFIASSFESAMSTGSVYCTYKGSDGLFDMTECEEACCSGVANSERRACCTKHDMPWEFILMVVFIVIAVVLMMMLTLLMRKYHYTLKASNMYRRMLERVRERSKQCPHTRDGENPPAYASLPPAYDVINSEQTEEDQVIPRCNMCRQTEEAVTNV